MKGRDLPAQIGVRVPSVPSGTLRLVAYPERGRDVARPGMARGHRREHSAPPTVSVL
jgi:hypothetical protein